MTPNLHGQGPIFLQSGSFCPVLPVSKLLAEYSSCSRVQPYSRCSKLEKPVPQTQKLFHDSIRILIISSIIVVIVIISMSIPQTWQPANSKPWIFEAWSQAPLQSDLSRLLCLRFVALWSFHCVGPQSGQSLWNIGAFKLQGRQFSPPLGSTRHCGESSG